MQRPREQTAEPAATDLIPTLPLEASYGVSQEVLGADEIPLVEVGLGERRGGVRVYHRIAGGLLKRLLQGGEIGRCLETLPGREQVPKPGGQLLCAHGITGNRCDTHWLGIVVPRPRDDPTACALHLRRIAQGGRRRRDTAPVVRIRGIDLDRTLV